MDHPQPRRGPQVKLGMSYGSSPGAQAPAFRPMIVGGSGKSSSGACLSCRVRRIKCDETRPKCLKCAKTNRDCPGYKDENRLKVRDMTARTIQKYTSKRRTPSTPPVTQLEHGPSSSTTAQSQPANRARTTSPRALAYSVEEQAMSFLDKYYLGGAGIYSELGFLNVMLKKGDPGPCLSASLSAVSLAVLSTRCNARNIRLQARASYSRALKAINSALERPDSTKDHRLLAAVLVLCVYETLVSAQFDAWVHHLRGAAAIIMARGRKMLRDPIGVELFRVAKTELVRASFVTYEISGMLQDSWLDELERYDIENDGADWSKEVPEVLLHRPPLYLESLDYSDMADWFKGDNAQDYCPGSGWTHHAARRHMGRRGSVEILLELVSTWIEEGRRPEEAPGRPQLGVTITDPASCKIPAPWMIFPECPVIMYDDVPAFKTEIVLSATRLSQSHMVSRLTRRIYGEDKYTSSPEYKVAALRARKELQQIIGSVPFACGFDVDGHDLVSESEPRPPPEGLGCAVAGFVSHIFLALGSDFATATERVYLLRMLRFVAEDRGISQAYAFLDAYASSNSLAGAAGSGRRPADLSGDLRALSSLGPAHRSPVHAMPDV